MFKKGHCGASTKLPCFHLSVLVAAGKSSLFCLKLTTGLSHLSLSPSSNLVPVLSYPFSNHFPQRDFAPSSCHFFLPPVQLCFNNHFPSHLSLFFVCFFFILFMFSVVCGSYHLCKCYVTFPFVLMHFRSVLSCVSPVAFRTVSFFESLLLLSNGCLSSTLLPSDLIEHVVSIGRGGRQIAVGQ